MGKKKNLLTFSDYDDTVPAVIYLIILYEE